MPTIFTHGLVGLAAAQFGQTSERARLFVMLSILLPIMPDLDVIGLRLGIDYYHWLGHRGFFHSPFFAAITALVVTAALFRSGSPVGNCWVTWGYFAIIISSHGLLDGMTNGGSGVAYLAPFSNERLFLPFTPIEVSPLTLSAFLSDWGWRVIKSEAVWIWSPVLLATVTYWIIKRRPHAK